MDSTPKLGNILIVDDDDNITDLLRINLKSEGYGVNVETVAENVDGHTLGSTSLVIVDAMQQPYSGMDLIFDLKEDPVAEHVGIILYSTYKSERMVIDALDAGADDYIVKPFSLRELIARVRSIIRRHRPVAQTSTQLTFGPLTLDQMSQTVKIDGKPLQLTKTEYAILLLLIKNVDSYVSRVEIHRRVWSDENAGINERIVDTNISRLRKKLGELGENIVSRTGHGYMLCSNS